MKKGELYRVYEDPITRQILEGIATIVECSDCEDTLHFCAVRFKDESQTYQRKVDEKDIVK